MASMFAPAKSLAQLTSQGNEQIVGYSGSTAFVLSQAPVNPNLLVTTGTNTFIMSVNPPTNAVRIYITNDTANACNNLTVSVASTGNSSLNSFNNNLAAWQTVNVQSGSGGFVGSSPITLPASGTVAVTSQPIIGSRIAVFLVLSSGCLTTTVDMQVVFGTFTPAIGAVQGITATGQAGTGVNPLIDGGLDTGGAVRPLKVCQDSSANACAGGTGYTIPIGAGGNTVASEYSPSSNSVTSPNAAGGPFATVIGGAVSSSGVSVAAFQQNGVLGGAAAGPPGLFETRAGFFKLSIGNTITATSDLSVTGTGAYVGAFNACKLTEQATLNSGTSPTLNVYLQQSDDGGTWTDRISMTQLLTSGNQWSAVTGGVGVNNTTFSNGTLAAGTKIDGGPIGPFLRIHAVAGGTSANWSLTWGVTCY
jgi:hypothetical protein